MDISELSSILKGSHRSDRRLTLSLFLISIIFQLIIGGNEFSRVWPLSIARLQLMRNDVARARLLCAEIMQEETILRAI